MDIFIEMVTCPIGQVAQVSEMPSGSDLGPKGAERVEILSWKPSGKKQHMYIWETPGVDRGLTCCFFLFFCLKLRLQRRYVQQPKLLDMLMKV